MTLFFLLTYCFLLLSVEILLVSKLKKRRINDPNFPTRITVCLDVSFVLSFCVSVVLSLCLSVFLSFNIFVFLSLSFCSFIFCLSVCIPVFLSVFHFVFLSSVLFLSFCFLFLLQQFLLLSISH